MGNIIKQRQELGKCTETKDVLIKDAIYGNPSAAADVVNAMVNLLGTDEATIESEAKMLARRDAIFNLAGRLSVSPALKELYDRPIAPDNGRGQFRSLGHGEETDRAQVAIVELVDKAAGSV